MAKEIEIDPQSQQPLLAKATRSRCIIDDLAKDFWQPINFEAAYTVGGACGLLAAGDG